VCICFCNPIFQIYDLLLVLNNKLTLSTAKCDITVIVFFLLICNEVMMTNPFYVDNAGYGYTFIIMFCT